MADLKVAIVADWLTTQGGAERTILSIAKLFPHAPIYTSVYDAEKATMFKDKNVYTSFIQGMPMWRKHQIYSALRPVAFESFDFSGYDLVISSSHAESKGILTRPETLHLCYCHTPTRYYWSDAHAYGKRLEFGILNPLARFAMPRLIHTLRAWDATAARRVDHFVANSRTTAQRIAKYYRRPSTLIHPFVDTQFFKPHPKPRAEYLLVVSRLIPYKKVDLAVEAATRLNLKLIVAGDGPERERLEKIAGPNVSFTGRISDEQMLELYQHCYAFLFPGEEDFGITPLEAMACGRPVIAYGKGGALETVVEGRTGTFFGHQCTDCLVDLLRGFHPERYSSATCRARAEEFSEAVFRTNWKRLIDQAWAGHQKGMWEKDLVKI